MDGLFAALKRDVMLAIRLLPVFVAVTLLLSPGGELQRYAFSIAAGGSLTLYEAAYGKGVVQIPSWYSWIFSGQMAALLALSTVTMTFAMKGRKARDVGFRAWAGVAIGLTIIDLINNFILKDTTAALMGENIAANFLGGGVVAISIVVLILFAHELTKAVFGAPRPWQNNLAVLALAALLFSTVLSGITFFFHPLPVDVRLQLRLPAKGYISPVPLEKEYQRAKVSILPPEGYHEPGEFDGFFSLPSAPGRLTAIGFDARWNWKAGFPGPGEMVSVAFYDGCYGVESEKLPRHPSPLVYRDAKQLQFGFEKDFSQAEIVGSGLLNANLITHSGTFFGLSKSDTTGKAETASITHYLQNDGAVEVVGTGTIKIRLSTLLPPGNDGKNRRFQLQVDGRTADRPLRLRPAYNWRAKLPCRPMRDKNSPLAAGSATVTITIAEASGVPSAAPSRNEMLRFKVQDGEFKQVGIPIVEANRPEMTAGFVGVSEGIESFSFADRKVEVLPGDRIWAAGDLKVVLREAKASVEGSARRLWKNEVRVNPTKWETLTEGWGIALIGAILAMMLAVLRSSILLLKRNVATDIARLVH
ncbi:MAG TPA: hypothetical protein VE053_11505 [Allosphingosinicella sp.]|nr:hypothetical protein [Allosphingosinicella sp.]